MHSATAHPMSADTAEVIALRRQVAELKRQLEWFKRQLFGRKSERFAPTPDPQQMHLGQLLGQDLPVPTEPAPAGQHVPAHTRRRPRRDMADDGACASFFDAAKVPVETIVVPNPEAQGLSADEYEVIGEKTTLRLAQRPGSYVVLKYVRPLIKRRDTQTLHCPPAPPTRQNSCRPDKSKNGGGDEGREWLDTDKHSRTRL